MTSVWCGTAGTGRTFMTIDPSNGAWIIDLDARPVVLWAVWS